MRSVSDLVVLMVAPMLGLVLLAFFAAPMHTGGWTLAPNVGLLLTLILVAFYPPAWPRWFAFLFGLLQDVIFGTPFGSQALLLLLTCGVAERLMQRGVNPPFRQRWLEATLVILVWHLWLWVVGHFVTTNFVDILSLLRAALATALWYPLFYFLFSRWALFT